MCANLRVWPMQQRDSSKFLKREFCLYVKDRMVEGKIGRNSSNFGKDLLSNHNVLDSQINNWREWKGTKWKQQKWVPGVLVIFYFLIWMADMGGIHWNNSLSRYPWFEHFSIYMLYFHSLSWKSSIKIFTKQYQRCNHRICTRYPRSTEIQEKTKRHDI